jgi:hypothetical protein
VGNSKVVLHPMESVGQRTRLAGQLVA